MNVAENLLLQQMQTMTNLPKTGNTSGSKEQSSSFQDLMSQQESAVDTGKDANPATDRPVKNGQAAESKEDPKTAPVQKKDGQKAGEQEVDPNMAVYAMDLFRPEIVDVSEPEAVTVEIPVEFVENGEPVMEAPVETAEAEAPVLETAVPVQQQEAQVQETPAEFKQAVEQTAEAAPEVEAGKPVTVEKPVEAPQDTIEVEKETAVETGELRDARPAEETSEDTDEQPQEDSVEVDAQPVFREVEAAPVKVAENYKSVDAEAPDMEEQIADKILTAAQNGVERIEIQLNPANLGALTISLARGTSGALEVVIHTAAGKTANLLNQHLDELHTALQTHGNDQPVHVEVQRNQESQEQRMFQQADPDGRGQHHQQQKEEHKENKESGEDFLQKLRLGLTSLED